MHMENLISDEESFFSNDKVGLPEAATLLGVSVATIKNWIRHEYLTPTTVGSKLLFDPDQLKDVKDRLATGQINRLNRRANKNESSTTFIPVEYAEHPEVISSVEFIVDIHVRENLDLITSLLAVILNFLEHRGLITGGATRYQPTIQTKHEILKTELQWWFERGKEISAPVYSTLFFCRLPNVRDLLGVLYQSLVKEGTKAKGGSYYTPKVVVDAIVGERVKEHSIVLDPCCGTGQFLLAAADNISNPMNIWGFDTDEVAVRIARLNLIARFPEIVFSPRIYFRNALLISPFHRMIDSVLIPEFDAVITNPPWGLQFSDQELSQLQVLFPTIRSNEAFSMFIQKGLQFLMTGGELSYILPEAVLNIKAHSDIRKVILESTRIQTVTHLGRIFQNVFTPCIRLDLKKEAKPLDNKLIAVRDHTSRVIEQNRLLKNTDNIFDIFNTNEDIDILDKISSVECFTLKGYAEWALGIVTGDNAKYLSDVQEEGLEPILAGKDIRRFIADPAKKFIKFTPDRFQQVAPIHRYRCAEKLMYKFISDELVFAYDDKQMLSLNSANILIPRLPGYSVKAVLAFLNSSLYQLVFQKRFGTFKILKGDIETLPFPPISIEDNQRLIGFVEVILNPQISIERKTQVIYQLDDYIMDTFGLDVKQKEYVRSNAKMSKKLFPFR
jgi:predicted RNA methylase